MPLVLEVAALILLYDTCLCRPCLDKVSCIIKGPGVRDVPLLLIIVF